MSESAMLGVGAAICAACSGIQGTWMNPPRTDGISRAMQSSTPYIRWLQTKVPAVLEIAAGIPALVMAAHRLRMGREEK